MGVGPLERSPDSRVTRRALLINGVSFSRHQALPVQLVHRMAGRTGDAASSVTTLNAPDMSGLIAMAAEAYFVDSRWFELRRIDDVIR
jgi:hypothetical protein